MSVSITQRAGKKGVSYRFQFETRLENGKRKTISKTWKPPKGLDPDVAEVLAREQAAIFEEECKSGRALSREELRKQLKANTVQQERTNPTDMTFRDYYNTVYKPLCFSGYSYGTKYNYELAVSAADKFIGNKKLHEITTEDIIKYKNSVSTHRISSSTQLFLILIQTILNMAVANGILAYNPVKPVISSREFKRSNSLLSTKSKILTLDQLAELNNELKEKPVWLQVFIKTLAETGCRCGELCGLKWECIDFERGLIEIKTTLVHEKDKSGNNIFVLHATKNSLVRKVSISPALISVLGEWKNQNSESIWVFHRPKHPDLPIPTWTITGAFRGLSQKLGFKVHAHMLRHTSISIALENGASVSGVSRRAGHSSIKTTLEVYTHALSGERKAGEAVWGYLDSIADEVDTDLNSSV